MISVNKVFYAHSERFQMQNMNVHIKAGEVVSLIGPNGSGKSTLLRLIARLLKQSEGDIVLDGKSIHTMKSADVAKQLAMLPQMHDHQLDLTVKELIEFGRGPHKSWRDRLNKEDEEIVDWALSVTNLEGYEYRLLQSLSGGERQRAWIAMTLAQRTNVLLLDEPTTFLDIVHQLEVMELVKRLNEEFGMTIIMVLHDINQAAQYSDRLLVLKRGKLQYDGIPEEVLCHEMFQHVFGIDVDIFQGSDKPFFTPKRISKKRRSKMRTEERITTELVREFVMAAHGDLEKVQELLAESPSLLHASYNWGGSDWESALGAAAHVGRKDIALYLLEKGARMDIFAAAMLGELEVVQAILVAQPEALRASGPHGISLLQHARMGGEKSTACI